MNILNDVTLWIFSFSNQMRKKKYISISNSKLDFTNLIVCMLLHNKYVATSFKILI